MTEEQKQAALRAALDDTLRRILRHRRQASEDVDRILAVLGERLCDRGFGGEELERLCPPGSDTDRERCRRGELSDDEARQLIEYLEKLYGPAQGG